MFSPVNPRTGFYLLSACCEPELDLCSFLARNPSPKSRGPFPEEPLLPRVHLMTPNVIYDYVLVPRRNAGTPDLPKLPFYLPFPSGHPSVRWCRVSIEISGADVTVGVLCEDSPT